MKLIKNVLYVAALSCLSSTYALNVSLNISDKVWKDIPSVQNSGIDLVKAHEVALDGTNGEELSVIPHDDRSYTVLKLDGKEMSGNVTIGFYIASNQYDTHVGTSQAYVKVDGYAEQDMVIDVTSQEQYTYTSLAEGLNLVPTGKFYLIFNGKPGAHVLR